MNSLRAARLLAAELSSDLPILDLHGYTTDQALEKIEIFLYNHFQSGTAAARIVYGIGSGRLSQVSLARLRSHPLVDILKDEGGSCIVVLAKGECS